MKNQRYFTLIELLVVIAIISILAGLVLAGVKGAITKAENTKAIADMTAIVNAVKQYEATYGRVPKHADWCDGNGKVTDLDAFYKMLQGEVKTTGNRRGIKLLSIKGTGPGKYIDPWDGDYTIYLDTDNDGKITQIPPGIDASTIYLSAVVFSEGPDGESGSDDTNDDNVYSFPVTREGNKFKLAN